MREVTGDFWEYAAPVKVITTNGFVKRDGRAVMGRGVAHQMLLRYPTVARRLGHALTEFGNHVAYLRTFPGDPVAYFSFPVKHFWRDTASLDLIKRSAEELVYEMNEGATRGPILLVRPGCGNGGLEWKTVRLILKPLLDDRFVIIERNG